MVDGKEIAVTTRDVEVFVREKKEVLTVDFVKPAAGTADLTVDYNELTPYPTKVSGAVTDNTIKDITSAIKNITGTIGKLPGATPPIALSSAPSGMRKAENVKTIESVIATRLFDIHEAGVQEQIHEFLHTHLNGCRPGCVAPVESAISHSGPVRQSAPQRAIEIAPALNPDGIVPIAPVQEIPVRP